ncbi:MAG TPA: DNA/RNA non-specific endonuclease, partial [Flavobacteriales bacterium]|nr:DNA/RNA non-specific endonuclease [Flavobacteriales bacterium]
MNQDTWFQLEAFARDVMGDGNELYIVAGGYGEGGTGDQGGTTTAIANGSIAVPARYWKVLLILPDG